jgi:hypothetical protein
MLLLAWSHFSDGKPVPTPDQVLGSFPGIGLPEEDQMKSRARLASLTVLLFMASGAHATDQGQFENVPDNLRSWFKSVKSPKGVPCCDISDGHRTDYDMRDGAYWVPIEGQWMQVPDGAVILDAGNPVGEAIVWYVHHRGSIVISCFVPGGGA